MDARLEELIEKNRDLLRERDAAANKGSYGKLLVIAGSRGMAGAAYLNAVAAFRTGIGMVRIFGPECNRMILQTALPESMYAVSDRTDGSLDTGALRDSIEWADYISVGSGLSKSPEAARLIGTLYREPFAALLSQKKLLILDADALNLIAEKGLSPGALCPHTVITPHIGEMSRLTGLDLAEIKRSQAESAERYSAEHGVTVVLKDAVTAIAVAPPPEAETGTGTASSAKSKAAMSAPQSEDPLLRHHAEIYRIDSGCGAMAKAGSGDVLCGFLAGVTAVLKGNVRESVPVAVWLHGRAGSIAAGRKGCHSILAGEIADAAGEALAEV